MHPNANVRFPLAELATEAGISPALCLQVAGPLPRWWTNFEVTLETAHIDTLIAAEQWVT